MDLNGTKTENFDAIEKAVREGEIDSLELGELKRIRAALLTASPLSDNPRFVQRWERVNAAVSEEIERRTTRRRFAIQVAIGLITLVLVLANIYLSHATP